MGHVSVHDKDAADGSLLARGGRRSACPGRRGPRRAQPQQEEPLASALQEPGFGVLFGKPELLQVFR